MEKIMSKASMRNSEADVRELRDDELEHVIGGRTMPNGKTDVIKVMGNYGKPPGPMEIWNDLLRQYGF
jgi:hypothetical protein